MTVCIWALADGWKSAVIMTDKMITFTMGSIQYQSDKDHYSKIYNIDDNIKLMVAWASTIWDDICKNLQQIIDQEKASWKTEFLIDEVIIQISNIYQTKRMNILESLVLLPRWINLQTYRSNMNAFQSIVPEIEQTFINYNLWVEIVAVWKNRLWKYSIYTIWNPWLGMCIDIIWYATIWSWWPHATLSILWSTYHKDLTNTEVLDILREAKRSAQYAPWVWQETSELILPTLSDLSIQEWDVVEEQTIQ
jgi:hypothetical protein